MQHASSIQGTYDSSDSKMSLSEKPPAIVIGFELNGLGVSRALHSAGISSIAISGSKSNVASHTRTADVRFLPKWDEENLMVALRALASGFSDRPPLLITKDEAVLWVSTNRDELSKHYRVALPSAETVDVLMNKRAFQKLALAKGWPVPKTWEIGSEVELEQYKNEIPFPCILKPEVKNSEFRRNTDKKSFKTRSREELFEVYRYVAQWEPTVVIQEWIEGGDDRIVFCLGYWSRDSVPKVIFSGRKIRQWPPECGNTAICEPLDGTIADTIADLTKKIFAETKFVGLGSVEFKLRPDGSPVIMEPTVGRTNYQNEIAVVNGVNIPAVAYFDSVGIAAPAVQRTQRPIALVDGAADLWSARHYIKEGKLTWRSYLFSRLRPSRSMILRMSDPGPAAALLYSLARRAARKAGRIAFGLRQSRK